METAFRQQSEQRSESEPRARTHDPAREVKDQAGEAWRGAKEIARARIGETQQEAARGLGDLAGALRHAAREVDDGRHATTAHLTRTAADALESASARLRNTEPAEIMREVETFARSQPLAFFGAAVAVGFLAVRFLKSSEEPAHAEPQARIETR